MVILEHLYEQFGPRIGHTGKFAIEPHLIYANDPVNLSREQADPQVLQTYVQAVAVQKVLDTLVYYNYDIFISKKDYPNRINMHV